MTDDKMTDYDEIIRYVQSMQVIEKLSSKYLHYLKSDRDDFVQEMYIIILTIPDLFFILLSFVFSKFFFKVFSFRIIKFIIIL